MLLEKTGEITDLLTTSIQFLNMDDLVLLLFMVFLDKFPPEFVEILQ